jgi:hypothetical protein
MTARSILALVAALFFAPAAHAQTNAATTNSSAVITTGNTFQTVLAALSQGTARRSLTIENNNATDSCWVFVGSGSATKATSILLLAGGSYARYYPYVPSDAIQATCASNSDTLYVDTQ